MPLLKFVVRVKEAVFNNRDDAQQLIEVLTSLGVSFDATPVKKLTVSDFMAMNDGDVLPIIQANKCVMLVTKIPYGFSLEDKGTYVLSYGAGTVFTISEFERLVLKPLIANGFICEGIG